MWLRSQPSPCGRDFEVRSSDDSTIPPSFLIALSRTSVFTISVTTKSTDESNRERGLRIYKSSADKQSRSTISERSTTLMTIPTNLFGAVAILKLCTEPGRTKHQPFRKILRVGVLQLCGLPGRVRAPAPPGSGMGSAVPSQPGRAEAQGWVSRGEGFRLVLPDGRGHPGIPATRREGHPTGIGFPGPLVISARQPCK